MDHATAIDLTKYAFPSRDVKEFYAVYNSVISTLPREVVHRLGEIQRDYFGAYGFEGVHERMGNQTIAQIFAEYKPSGAKPAAEGERDGVRFGLYDPSSQRDRDKNER